MAIDFPNSPSTGSTFTSGGKTWQYDGVKWTAASSSSVYPPNANVGRNLLHNGLMNIAQRGIGPFTGNAYTLDRWVCNYNLDSISFSQQAMLLASDEQARNCLRNVFTGNAGAAAYSILYQPIEDVSRLSNKTVTVSFWAAATVGTPKLGVSLDQSFGTGGSPTAQANGIGQATPALGSAWTRYSFTFALPSIAGATLGTNGNHYTALNIWFSSGTTQAARAGNIGVQSGTVLLWGVQLEIGNQATALEKLDPRMDLANCQRFFCGTMSLRADSYGAGTANISWHLTYPVQMRAAPTIAFPGPVYGNCSGLTPTLIGPADATYFVTVTATGSITFSLGGPVQISADL